ncbi:MAG: MerR family transcriptional regulator [Actinomycetota bacterium]|nr:MerR family transcriptional regulator [Actinomycetota bacterium]
MQQASQGLTMTIGQLARQAGVPVSTIRAWEQRYGLLLPARSPGGHRRYSVDDLRRLRAVQALVEQGVTLAAATEHVMAETADSGTVGPAPPAASVPTLDPAVLAAAYRATRALLTVRAPDGAVDVLVALVRELGGDVVPAEEAGADALPLDLSLGERPPLLPVADPFSVARLQLERCLPTVVEDARRAATIARRLSLSEGGDAPG